MPQVTLIGNQLAAPIWAGDRLDSEHLFPGGGIIDAAQFLAEDGTTLVVDTAGAAANATSIPLKAPGPRAVVPSGTVLYFGASKKFALTTASAGIGATSVAVQALPTALVDTDTATYPGSGTKKKVVPSGTAVGRTFTERAAGTAFGPADAADDEVILTASEVPDAARDNSVALYRYGSIVKENLLPGFANIASGVLAKIRANYQTTRGAA